MFGLGTPELIIIAVVIVVLFGVGRISKVGGELGSAINEFRKGLSGKDEKTTETKEEPPAH